MKALLDWVEDQVLGLLAKERQKGTPRKAYLSLEKVEQRLKTRHKTAHRLKVDKLIQHK